MPRRRDVSERGLYAMLAIVALLVIYLVAFVVANTDRVEVSFVMFDARASLIWVMLVCTVIGVGLGIAATSLLHRTRGTRRTSVPGPGATVTAPLVEPSPPARRPTDPPA
jgi:uncharacterized integral membrane protein